MLQLFWRLVEAFRFIARHRARVAGLAEQLRLERQAERDHQALLLKTFLSSLETIQEASAKESSVNAGALVEVAKGITAQAESFGNWIKLFNTTSVPTTSVVRESDEYQAEQLANLQNGLPADIAALPEEFQLAYALRNDPNLGSLNIGPVTA